MKCEHEWVFRKGQVNKKEVYYCENCLAQAIVSRDKGLAVIKPVEHIVYKK